MFGLTTIYKYLAIGAGLLSLFGLGVLYGHHTTPPVIVTQTQVVEKRVQGATQIVYKDRIITKTVTTTKKPDGTVTTTETDKTEDKDKDTSKTISKDLITKDTEQSVAPAQQLDRNYMVGIYKGVHLDLSARSGGIDTGVGAQVGRRLGTFDDLDVWITGGYQNLGGHPEGTIGIAVTF